MGEEVAAIEVAAAPVDGSVPGDGMETGEAAGIEALAGEAMTGGVGLRGRVARGVIVNSAFQIGLAGLGLFRTVAIAGFLTASEFGLWGLIITTVMTLSWLKQIGVGDKYQQQDEPDQVVAFQKAFTLELGYSLLWWGLIALALPLYASIYGQPRIIVPGILLTLCLPLSAFETPIWIAYRQMRFVRQRALMAVDQVTAAVTMIVLAIAGLGYWSLVIGALAGSAAGAVAAVVTCPYPIRLRFDRATLRGYYSYSWPLVLSNVSSLVVVQGSIIAGNATVGLAGVGAIAIAGNFTRFIGRVETIIKSTMYPAAC